MITIELYKSEHLIKYDENKEYDIAFGEEFERDNRKHKTYSYSNMSTNPQLIELCDIIIRECIELEAIDIQLTQLNVNTAVVRAKLGTRMEVIRRIDARAINGLVQAMKYLSGMSVSEGDSKVPQDGRYSLVHEGIMYSLRVNSIPSHYCETLSLRILKNDDSFSDLDVLGMPDIVVNRFRRVIRQSEGMIILSGATGSGKSLRDDTYIPLSEDGFKKIGELEVGDKVMDKYGRPTSVVGVYPQEKLQMYKFTLSDNSVVYSGEDHKWVVEDTEGHEIKTVVTDNLVKNFKPNKYYIENILSVVNTSNIESEEIDYYNVGRSIIVNHMKDKTSKEDFNWDNTLTYELYYKITKLDRVRLIKGLMSGFLYDQDKDTYIVHKSLIRFHEMFVEEFRTLVTGIGFSVFYNISEDEYEFNITTEVQYKGRYIVNIEDAGKDRATCIEVDAEDSLFLATKTYLPTHNTTTMYTAVKEIIRKTKGSKNIHTLENPIESMIPFTVQNEVNETEGFDYSLGVKSLLRQNPDIILVGEIRDKSSAQTSLRAATSGHLLLTSLHANNVLAVPMVLSQYGLNKNEISNALQMVLNQRIVDKLCDNCKATQAMNNKVKGYLRDIGVNITSLKVATRSTEGCEHCEYTGYRGKLMVVEMLDADRNFDTILQDAQNEFQLKKGLLNSSKKSYYSKEEDVARHLKDLTMDLKTAEEVIR